MKEKTKDIKENVLLSIGIFATFVIPWVFGLAFYATCFYGHRMF